MTDDIFDRPDGVDPADAGDRMAEGGGDRRRGARHASVLLVGRLCADGGESVCLVHDISADGLMARFAVPPRVGQAVRVAVRGMAPAAARVRWVRGSKAGLQFDEPQDLGLALGHDLQEGRMRRAPRFPVGAATTLRVDGAWRVVELLDLSAGGAKLAAGPLLESGVLAQLTLPTLTMPVQGSVQWQEDGRVGMRFLVPLELAVLSDILAAIAASGLNLAPAPSVCEELPVLISETGGAKHARA